MVRKRKFLKHFSAHFKAKRMRTPITVLQGSPQIPVVCGSRGAARVAHTYIACRLLCC